MPMDAGARIISVITFAQVVLNADLIRLLLPAVVEAFFYPASGSRATLEETQQSHEAFLRHYRLDALDVPLLRYDPGTSLTAPFSL